MKHRPFGPGVSNTPALRCREGARPGPLRPYWLGRFRRCGKSLRLPPRSTSARALTTACFGLACASASHSAEAAWPRVRYDPRCRLDSSRPRRRTGIDADRANRVPLLRFRPLQHLPAALRCPVQPAPDYPASTLTRFACRGAMPRRRFPRARSSWRFFAWHAGLDDPVDAVRFANHASQHSHSVRCSAIRGRMFTACSCRPGTRTAVGQRALMGFALRSFAPARGRCDVSTAAFPTCRWPNVRLDGFGRGINRLCSMPIFGHTCVTGSGRSWDVRFGSWDTSAGKPRPPALSRPGRSCPGLRLLQVFGHRMMRPCGLDPARNHQPPVADWLLSAPVLKQLQ